MSRLLFINPIGTNCFDADLQTRLPQEVGPGTTVDVVSLPRGPHHVEYHYYEALVLPDLLHLIKQAEHAGYDAAIIGCFYDFGLKEAREITHHLVVTAPCESGALLACSLGDKFSVIVGRRKWIPDMRENIYRIGLRDRLASFRSVDLGVHEFHQDETETRRRFVAAGQRCIEEDGAEVLLLGCTATYGFYQELQEELGVPVIDPTLAPLKYAEYLVELRQRFGWQPSKIGLYEGPPSAEIHGWRLAEQYPASIDLW
jgi:allantoin racemase